MLIRNFNRALLWQQLLNLVIAKYLDLSVPRRSIICISFRLRQITDLLVTDKSRYFSQPPQIFFDHWITKFVFILRRIPGYKMNKKNRVAPENEALVYFSLSGMPDN